jgi:hypothetical protein
MLGGKEPREGVIFAFEASTECFVLCDDYGFAVAIGGIATNFFHPEEMASPWLMACQGLSMRHIRFLIEYSRDTLLPEWAAKYGTLYNHVWLGNKLHVEWCKAVGFTLGDAFEHNAALYTPVTLRHVRTS